MCARGRPVLPTRRGERRRPPRSGIAGAALAALAWACGGTAPVDNSEDGGAKATTDPGRRPGNVENLSPARVAPADTGSPAEPSSRGATDQASDVARALEDGRLDDADMLLVRLDPFDANARLLRARLLCRRGETVHALRELEAARRAMPAWGAVSATVAELYVELGRLEAARAEIQRGLELAGPCAELERARGIYWLAREGGAKQGLSHLLRARELDPRLDFVDGPLAQAYLLVGRAHLREASPLEAVRAARAGLVLEPASVPLRQLHGDALQATGALRSAVGVFEELLADGESVEHDLALLCWRAGMGELVQRRRAAAVELWARARELGMTDEALGSAASILAEEALLLVARGIACQRDGRVEAARDLFAEALHLDPENLTAECSLAATHRELGALELAAEGFERVLAACAERDALPPEPVHLDAARIRLLLGQPEAARELLRRHAGVEADVEDVERVLLELERARGADLPSRAAAGDR